MEDQGKSVVKIGALELRFIAGEANHADITMFEFVVPPQARVPAAHYHREVDEIVYGLAGTMTSTLDGKKYELKKGDSLFIPRGSVHIHENLHPDTAEALIVMTPGSIGRRYFEEMAEQINVPGKPDLGKVKEIMVRHGLVPA